MSWAGLWTTDPAQSCRPAGEWVATALRSTTPALLFGLRLWAAVCLALYITFWLQLDNAFWAGTSAAIVCQPRLGASLRKGWFRMVGTAVGGIAELVDGSDKPALLKTATHEMLANEPKAAGDDKDFRFLHGLPSGWVRNVEV